MPVTSFHSELRQWIEAVIRQRRKLIDLGRSRVNTFKMNIIIDELDKQLKAWHFRDDVKMAAFFQRNKEKIHALLPGEGSSCHLKKEKEFQTFHYNSLKLLSHEDLSQRKNSKRELCRSV